MISVLCSDGSQTGAVELLLFDGLLLPHVIACIAHLSWSVRRYVMDTLLFLITEDVYQCYAAKVGALLNTGASGLEAEALPDDVPTPHLLLVHAWEKSALVLDEYTPYSTLVLVMTNMRGICNEEKLLQRDDYHAFLVYCALLLISTTTSLVLYE